MTKPIEVRLEKRKLIVAIGGAVIKTAWDEIKEAAERKMFDVLIHNGGSMFHDFQRATDKKLMGHSYPLEKILESQEILAGTSEKVWDWVIYRKTPGKSLTAICNRKRIKVLMFTGLACDFWQILETTRYALDSMDRWEILARSCFNDFQRLCKVMSGPFHFLCMGSAVIHPEVFTKALAVVKPKDFRADAVDFLEAYRPRTRVSRYGEYYKTTHKKFLKSWLNGKDIPRFQDSTGDG